MVMTDKFEFERVEKDWDRGLADECYKQLDKTQQDLNSLFVEERALERQQEETKVKIEHTKTFLKEELDRVARLIGDCLTLENIQLEIKPKILDPKIFRLTKGKKGKSYGNPYKVSLDYIKVYEMSYYWHDDTPGFQTHHIVEYCFLWPSCGCKMYSSLHLTGIKVEGQVPLLLKLHIARWGQKEDEVYPYPEGEIILSNIKQEIGDLFGQQIFDGELRCPKCQTCSQELDYLCDGFEEIEPLTEFIASHRGQDAIRGWNRRSR
jgi:hypothetical protein